MGQQQPQNRWFKSSNPTLRDDVFEQSYAAVGERMSVAGTLQKTGLLLGLTVLSGTGGWWFFVANPSMAGLASIASFIVALVLGLIIGFKPTAAPALAPAYALVKGVAVGVISAYGTSFLIQQKSPYANIVPIAAVATFLTMAVMLGLYSARIIRVTETLRGVIIGLTLATGLFYLFGFGASFIAPAFAQTLPIFSSSPIGIGFSIFVIALAAFNFLLDFDFIERGVQSGAPKHLEWYAGFGLLVTAIWLYIEIIRLAMKLASNR